MAFVEISRKCNHRWDLQSTDPNWMIRQVYPYFVVVWSEYEADLPRVELNSWQITAVYAMISVATMYERVIKSNVRPCYFFALRSLFSHVAVYIFWQLKQKCDIDLHCIFLWMCYIASNSFNKLTAFATQILDWNKMHSQLEQVKAIRWIKKATPFKLRIQ